MYTQDKILNGGEITVQGEFTLDGGLPFYVFLAPKNEDASGIAILDATLNYADKPTAFPFIAGAWNPVVVKKLSVKSTDLTNYRIFYGTEK